MNRWCCGLLLVAIWAVCHPAKGQSVVLYGSNTEEVKKDRQISMSDFTYHVNHKKAAIAEPVRRKPGLALLSSVILPGAGQAANGKWVRAGAYFVAEALLLTVHFSRRNKARKLERRYEDFAKSNWSVVTYARWLDNYHTQNGIAGGTALNELREQLEGVEAAYDHDTDWNNVDIELLREVERNTPFIYPDGSSRSNFSHTLPNYGSQQYFELISKYFQYGPGWRDFGINKDGEAINNRYRLRWDGSDLSPNFFEGSALAERFNDNYRIAGNMVSLLVLNHIVSAFDAFLTVKIKNNRLKAETNLFSPEMFSIKYRF